jgi:hypothetical protein
LAYNKRLKRLEIDEIFYDALSEYRQELSIDAYRLIMKQVEQLFIITYKIGDILMDVCIQHGWRIIKAEGQAALEIARRGGIVMTEGSDMIFHPTIEAVIRPYKGKYHLYQRSEALHHLDITSEAFVALRMLSENNYTPDQHERIKMYGKYCELREYCKIPKDTVLIHGYEDCILSPTEMTQVMIQKFLSSMHLKIGVNVPLDAYESPFRVFMLQQEKLILKVNKIQAVIKSSYYYYCFVHDSCCLSSQ